MENENIGGVKNILRHILCYKVLDADLHRYPTNISLSDGDLMKRVNTCSNTKNSKSIRDKKNCDTL
jgi:hypothetical protein